MPGAAALAQLHAARVLALVARDSRSHSSATSRGIHSCPFIHPADDTSGRACEPRATRAAARAASAWLWRWTRSVVPSPSPEGKGEATPQGLAPRPAATREGAMRKSAVVVVLVLLSSLAVWGPPPSRVWPAAGPLSPTAASARQARHALVQLRARRQERHGRRLRAHGLQQRLGAQQLRVPAGRARDATHYQYVRAAHQGRLPKRAASTCTSSAPCTAPPPTWTRPSSPPTRT